MCNIMLHLKLRVEKNSFLFFGMFWNRPFPAIITSAPQAKFLSFFQSENRGNDQDLGCFFRIFLASFLYCLNYHKCAAGGFKKF